MIQSSNSGHAKSYFNDALSKGDYYLDDQELGGNFHGKIAERLNLSGSIEKNDFYRLCENINPNTGNRLTPRTKSNRTVGYDINFHCPKSVSILNALGNDKRVMQAFRSSVYETMLCIEKDSKTRVRENNRVEERDTGELIWGEFVHQTARPVDGSPPDPHLHAHCFVLNTTWDKVEGKYKAGQFRDIKRDMPYYQSLFQKKLSDKLNALGYSTSATQKAFEVDIIPKKAIAIFSKRSDEIGRFAKDRNITDKAELDRLGARTRSKKNKDYAMTDLREHWRSQVRHIESETDTTSQGKETVSPTLSATQCIDFALEHCFERHSVVQDRVILTTAIEYGLRDPKLDVQEIELAFQKDDRIIRVPERNRIQCTTIAVHREEKAMITLAKQSKGKFRPIRPHSEKLEFSNLNNQQERAVKQVLESIDGITIIRGGAGTGKTTLMKSAIDTIEASGFKVYTFAPSSEASRDVLRKEGFENADTVAKLLLDDDLKQEITNQVLWIDEAGLLSTKDMVNVLSLAQEKNARVVLSGDTRQHSSVRRGDALRILRTVGDINVAGVNRIYRQKSEEYKKAVSDISEGKIEKGFERLDRMGAIVEREAYQIADQLVSDYMDCRLSGKSSLIIAPTHDQGEAVTDKIRANLKSKELIGKKDRTFERLKNKNLTTAEKQDVKNYAVGEVVQFHQNVRGIKRGAKLTIHEVNKEGILLNSEDNNSTIVLPLTKTERFDVYTIHRLELGKGDRLRITKNGFDAQGIRMDNGKLMEVKGFDRMGNIRAVSSGNPNGTEFLIDKAYGNFNHGYVMTSHASQGKTVDKVFIAQPSGTFPASNAKQFYVSVSRGREDVKIYTDSKEDLLDHIIISGDRMSATELKNKHKEAFTQRISTEKAKQQFKQQKTDFNKNTKLNDKDYEP